jgi:putative addiction module killer protein
VRVVERRAVLTALEGPHVVRMSWTRANVLDILVTLVLPSSMVEIRYYVASGETAPFADWFAGLDPIASAKITRAIARMEQGNFSNVKSVGQGVLEYRIDFGPGYRIYFGRDGNTIVILLTGGTKKQQQRDIEAAHDYWRAYKQSGREQR